ncbi:Probable histone H2A.1, partial [Linum perenne]
MPFPVGRIGRYLKKGRYAQRVGTGAPVYMGRSPRVLELAGNVDHDNKKNKIARKAACPIYHCPRWCLPEHQPGSPSKDDRQSCQGTQGNQVSNQTGKSPGEPARESLKLRATTRSALMLAKLQGSAVTSQEEKKLDPGMLS